MRINKADISQVLIALANRLTATDNFGPEGRVDQVLTSNGATTPPSYRDIDETIRRVLREEGLIS